MGRPLENGAAISPAPPTSTTTMKPTKVGVIPNACAAFCADSTKISLPARPGVSFGFYNSYTEPCKTTAYAPKLGDFVEELEGIK